MIYLIEQAPVGNYYMGVSLMSNTFFSKHTLREYCYALEGKARSLLIIIADSLEKWNYIYFKKYSYHEAREKAVKVGMQYKIGYEKLLQEHPNIMFKLSSEIEDNDKIERIKKVLINVYVRNTTFCSDVKGQVIKNIGNKIGMYDLSNVPDILANYILEELAISIYYFKSKWIQVSPRENNIFVDIYMNKYPDITDFLEIELQNYQYVVYCPKIRRQENEYLRYYNH